MSTITKVIGSAKGFYDVARYLKKDRESGADRDTGFRMGYNVSPEVMEAAREMAQAAEGRLMHEPCLHVVLSPEQADGGRLSQVELEHMVGDLRREMGWQDYQILAVEHLDTDHQHVHLMINRAHPLHTGESIDGYYLYKDLRHWAQDFDARQKHRTQEAEEVALDPAARGYVTEPSPGAEEMGQHHLTNLQALSDEAGLHREVSTLAELERLAHEKEMAVAMLRADKLHLETTGQGLLSDEGRTLLRQTAREINIILEHQHSVLQTDPMYRGDGMPGPEPSLEVPSAHLPERIKESYQQLLREASPYWMHPEAAVRDMKDLAVLREPEAVTWAIRHEPEAVGERTAVPMSESDVERVAQAYRQYEAHRRQYVAGVMERMDPAGRKTRIRSNVSERMTDGPLKDPARGAEPSFSQAIGDAAQSMDPVERAEQLFYRDVASRLVSERLERVEAALDKAKVQARQLHEAVRERAYHHLHAALSETYKDPAEAFKRLEAYHRRGQAHHVLQKPELLGEMNHIGVGARARGETLRKRAADIVRRYGAYIGGPDVRGPLDAARRHTKRLEAQRKVLTAIQQRVGTPEAIQKKYGEVRKALTAREHRRLGVRLRHLPASEVRRRSGALLKKALRSYPGTVRPGQIKGLASQRAVDRAIRKSARSAGKKMAVRQPLQFAMRAGGVATRVASAVYRSAKVFFER